MGIDKIRFSGLASGMDTESMVKQLMQAERIPLNKLEQKKQTLEWKRDQYREMNLMLAELDKFIFDGVGKQSTFLKKKIVSSDESKVTATSVGASSNTSTKLEVSRLASAESWNSEAAISFTAGTAYAADFKVTDPDGTVRTKTVNIKDTDNIDAAISAFNNAGLGVTAMKGNILDDDGVTYREMIVLTQNKTGSGASIEVTNTDATQLMEKFGFRKDDGTTYALNETLVPKQNGQTGGQDAIVKINDLQMYFKSNEFEINGMKYNIKNTTGGTPVTISSTTDVDGVVESIKAFMDKYNEILEKFGNKLNEEKYKEFAPLTKEQKEQLSKEEIEKWEEKAKSGLLRRDTLLTNNLSKMRMALTGEVNGALTNSKYDHLSEIGIVTSSNYLENGKLVLDPTKIINKMIGEDRLRKAIEEDPEAVFQLFFASGETSSEKGVARRLREEVQSSINRIDETAGKATALDHQFRIGRDLSDLNNRIESFEDKLKRAEDRYWRQFTAMEKAMQRANEQAAYIANAFGGGAQQ
ncbi:flagellar hook-associated protein 2 [Bacillus salitolerans]|uniref:Flagellar hook-associated protein 2 n=1 Tax=Bacillus salitolerans TaxID=1437434 RepID=A0ABW4LNK1_9BACI